jgi:2,3-bisphosphoglycerate-dependent phosphoglycerate mutase
MNATPAEPGTTMASGHHQTRWAAPPGSSTITLLRHGASEGYIPGQPFPLANGHGDPALAPDGCHQAGQAARRLSAEHADGRPIQALYVTTLRRTHQTAEPLAEATGLVPVVEPELREVFLGDWEGGLFRQYVAEGHPAAMAAVSGGEWGAVPGAETSAALADRAMGALERLADRHVDQRVVAVVHGGIIDAIVSRITGGLGGQFLGADNCSISTVVRTPAGWRVRGFNDTSHLDGGWS